MVGVVVPMFEEKAPFLHGYWRLSLGWYRGILP